MKGFSLSVVLIAEYR